MNKIYSYYNKIYSNYNINVNYFNPCFQTGGSLQQVMTFDLHGCKTLTITAVLQGGKGDLAWQHTQLFRQSTNDRDSYPFEIKLILN